MLPRRSLTLCWFFFFFFLRAGAPVGGSSPGQLQMRNSWPAALADAQIRPFENITVLLPPPPPVGHARSAEGRGMWRRAGGRGGGVLGEWGTGGRTSSDLFQKVFLITFLSTSSSPPVFKCFNFSCAEQDVDCSQIKPDRVFPAGRELCDTVQLGSLLACP